MSEDPVYKLPAVTDAELRQTEVYAIIEMFDSPGWKALMKHRAAEIAACVDVGMGLDAPENRRVEHRALYHAALAEVAFSEMFVEAVREFEKEANLVLASDS